MKSCALIIVLSLFIASTAAMDVTPFSMPKNTGPIQVGPTVSLVCLFEHCLTGMLDCFAVDKVCRDSITCVESCLADWDKDKTKEKFTVQNCTNICQFSYYDKTIDKFMGCVTDHNCIGLPPIPDTCRTSTVKPSKELSVKDLDGYWWVVQGYHPVYDCYSCQHPHFRMLNASFWEYAPSYLVPLANGSQVIIAQHFAMPNAPAGQNISFSYYDAGLLHYETWWLLDKADDGSYLLVYYCGNTMNWNYEGAIVLSRNTSLPEETYTKIAATYKSAVGLDFSLFCKDDLEKCNDFRMN